MDINDSNDEKLQAAEALLRALHNNGVEYLFGTFGSDHAPIMEAAAQIRTEDGGAPVSIVTPHEAVAMSAATGYAAYTADPQAVMVHVDVGTQNLGAMVHNAHRGGFPVFIIAGIAPVTDQGYPGSRDHTGHYTQDLFDQPGIVREYCRWIYEYRPPADPDVVIRRGLERATSEPSGPVYLTAAREALESQVKTTSDPSSPSPRSVQPAGADADTIQKLTELITSADNPLVITAEIGTPPAAENVNALVSFAEAAGAGVVESVPPVLSFPRDHPLHVGFDPNAVIDKADLVMLVDVDIPWLPIYGGPSDSATVIQIDADPTKSTYPYWDFPIDHTVQADPAVTLNDLAANLPPGIGQTSFESWARVSTSLREERLDRLDEHRAEGRLTPEVLSASIAEVIDDDTIIVEGAVTSTRSLQEYLEISEPGRYFSRHGSGLGWANGAAVGMKIAAPDKRVIATVGDGAYFFSHPSACAWLAADQDAPTLTVIYNNGGWKAVRGTTEKSYPEGRAMEDGVVESQFRTPYDLTAPANVVEVHTDYVSNPDDLHGSLDEAVGAVDDGLPAVIDVKIERT